MPQGVPTEVLHCRDANDLAQGNAETLTPVGVDQGATLWIVESIVCCDMHSVVLHDRQRICIDRLLEPPPHGSFGAQRSAEPDLIMIAPSF